MSQKKNRTQPKAVPTLFDRMCWAACPLIRQWTDESVKLKKCKQCPAYEIDKDYGEMTRGCRAIVEEIIAPAFELIKGKIK